MRLKSSSPCVYFALIFTLKAFAVGSEITITSIHGDIQGNVENALSVPVARFLGIPYAQPPLGERRFKPPEKASTWSGVKNATSFGHNCMQNDLVGYDFYGPNSKDRSEDCLYLNVYVPKVNENSTDFFQTSQNNMTHSDIANSSLPVMVWIHGGGYYIGAGADYDMSGLAASGQVVVVTINYRLDLLGLLSTEDDVMPGNYGLLDQIMALTWVKENIESFGGNPGEVTIFGESAGSGSVSLLLLSPLAQGLFHRAIMESGASLCAWAVHHPGDMMSPRTITRLVGIRAGCSNLDNTTELFSCLQRVDSATLLNISKDLSEATRVWQLARPRVETTFGFLPELPINLLQKGKFNNVDMIYGFNNDEYGVMADFIGNSTDSVVLRDLFSQFPTMTQTQLIKAINTSFPVDAYPDRVHRLVKVASDILFKAPIMFEINEKLKKSNASMFLYEFEKRPGFSTVQPPWVSAVHGDEIRYVLDIRHRQFYDPDFVPPSDDVIVSRTVVEMWTNFAKTGTPNSGQNKAVTWAPFTEVSPRFLKINTTSEMSVWNRPELVDFFKTYLSLTETRNTSS